MSLMAWNPFREMETLFDRHHRALSRSGLNENGELAEMEWAPSVDISESEEEYLISADLPGVDKKDIKVSVDNGVLRIEGERRMEKEVDDKKLHRVERFYGHFARQFTVPEDADTSQIKAHSRDGTLQVHLPRISKPESDKRQVEIH